MDDFSNGAGGVAGSSELPRTKCNTSLAHLVIVHIEKQRITFTLPNVHQKNAGYWVLLDLISPLQSAWTPAWGIEGESQGVLLYNTAAVKSPLSLVLAVAHPVGKKFWLQPHGFDRVVAAEIYDADGKNRRLGR